MKSSIPCRLIIICCNWYGSTVKSHLEQQQFSDSVDSKVTLCVNLIVWNHSFLCPLYFAYVKFPRTGCVHEFAAKSISGSYAICQLRVSFCNMWKLLHLLLILYSYCVLYASVVASNRLNNLFNYLIWFYFDDYNWSNVVV